LKELKEILFGVNIDSVYGDTNLSISGISFDSRQIKQNNIFIAIKGYDLDGHNYIDQSINNGAIVVVCESLPKTINKYEIVFIKVKCSKIALYTISSNLYGNPSSKIDLIGVTGTNGKTTITSLLYKLFNNQGIKSGLISTINIEYEEFTENSKNTTPDPILLNHHLNEMVKRNIKVCFIEVSSHGIKQKRVFGKDFKGIVFTNLTHDHIDYHKTFKDYRDTKKEVFDTLNKKSFALINIDDKNGKFMTQNSSARVYTYSLKSKSNFSCRIVEQQLNGMLLNMENSEIWTKLIGEFNAYNLLAIYSVGKIYEIDSLNLLTNISELNSVQGRLQSFLSNSNVTVIIDYAHTPDAVENVLSTINKIKKSNQNLITVIGCGGDRDKAKRSMIGKICSDLSYKVIFTSDNPRSENPESIIKDIVSGVSNYNNNKILVQIERSKAIEEAKKNSEEGDIVLIAGKGHEDYQILKNKVIKFDDFKIAKKIFNK
jgi:UDP-N-acetylmuramoyl-L-alanyl-D-glutamate--2,6-diaminopimelate ligase|tara:strand:+ start:382 stop:1839 length:1458 start_codon:yes stop_codon:yes gene_type:complete